jgi:hypothetical protein
LSTYHDIISIVESDLLLMEQQKQAYTPIWVGSNQVPTSYDGL